MPTKTLLESQVEAWLSSLERSGLVITSMTQASAPGGKVKVTVTTTPRQAQTR